MEPLARQLTKRADQNDLSVQVVTDAGESPASLQERTRRIWTDHHEGRQFRQPGYQVVDQAAGERLVQTGRGG
jgi:hypothetical protein